MRAFIVVTVCALCVWGASTAHAGEKDRLYQRIHQLRIENERLREEVVMLRQREQQRHRPTYRGSYGNNRPMYETNQSLRELEQMRNSVERLTR